MKFNSAKVWPYAIAASIIMVFGFCVATIVVAFTLPVEKSDTYMMDYHQADDTANDLIINKINFDKEYKIEYITQKLSQEDSVIKYRVSKLDGTPSNDAKILVVITRPNNHKHDQEVVNPSVENGVYTFKSVKLAQPGRWDIMARVSINDLTRYYNVKADTRAKEAFQY